MKAILLSRRAVTFRYATGTAKAPPPHTHTFPMTEEPPSPPCRLPGTAILWLRAHSLRLFDNPAVLEASRAVPRRQPSCILWGISGS